MSYQASWFNYFEQLGHVDITLLLTDDEKILPDVRIEKNYDTKQVTVSDIFLEGEAATEIARVLYEIEHEAERLEAEADALRAQAEVLAKQADDLDAKAEEIKE